MLEAPLPVVIGGTQALGEPRYPSLKGIMAARNKEIVTRSLADLGLDGAAVGGAVATTTVLDSRSRRPAPRPRSSAGRRPKGRPRIVDFLVERRII